MDAMKYNELRDFLTLLEQQGELKRITLPVDPHLEITEIADRTLRAGGPALLFENPKGYSMPVLCNCSVRQSAWRWAWGRKMFRRCVKLVNYWRF